MNKYADKCLSLYSFGKQNKMCEWCSLLSWWASEGKARQGLPSSSLFGTPRGRSQWTGCSVSIGNPCPWKRPGVAITHTEHPAICLLWLLKKSKRRVPSLELFCFLLETIWQTRTGLFDELQPQQILPSRASALSYCMTHLQTQPWVVKRAGWHTREWLADRCWSSWPSGWLEAWVSTRAVAEACGWMPRTPTSCITCLVEDKGKNVFQKSQSPDIWFSALCCSPNKVTCYF